MAARRAVVLGVGNILLSDEGIGVHAVNALEARYEIPAEVEIIDGGTSAMDCLDRIAESDFLLIADCVRGGREPGSLVRLGDGELQAFFRTRISPHQVGLCDVLATLYPAWTFPVPNGAHRCGAEVPGAGPGTNARACGHDPCLGGSAYGGVGRSRVQN